MINQLLIFKFIKNIFLQLRLVIFLPITTNSILYANLNSFLVFYIKCYLLTNTFDVSKISQNLQWKMIQNQNKEEENYYPISLQISIWNDMNSKLTIIFFVCTNYKSIYLSHPILLTCPIFMLPTCSFNNPPPYFGFYVQTLRKKQVFCIDFVTKF
jgi:hypothetical protein